MLFAKSRVYLLVKWAWLAKVHMHASKIAMMLPIVRRTDMLGRVEKLLKLRLSFNACFAWTKKREVSGADAKSNPRRFACEPVVIR